MDISTLWPRWLELKARGSIRQSRTIEWPRPYVLKQCDSVAKAQEQDADGYVGDQGDVPVHITVPFDWSLNPFRSKPWRVRLMCLQPIDAYFYAYEESDDARWLQKAIDLVLDWSRYHVTDGVRTYQAWTDMPCGYRAIKIARLIDDAVEGAVTLEQKDVCVLLHAADRHLQELAKPHKLSAGNHGIFQLHGLRILSEIYWNSTDAASADRFVSENLPKLLRLQFNEEGVHLEHSPNYHWWMAEELSRIEESGWHRDRWLGQVRSRVEEAKHWLVDPSGNMLRIGDTARSGPAAQPGAPIAPDYENQILKVRVFPKGGYAICKTTDSMLFFQCAYHSTSHKHSDDLHFDLHDHGVPIFVDAGSCGYKVGEARAYILSTRAHNTVQVADADYPRDGTDRFGSALVGAVAYENGVAFEARVDHASLGVIHHRALKYYPGQLLVVDDQLVCAEHQSVTQWFHLSPEWGIVSAEDTQLRAVYGERTVALQIDDDAAVRHHFGEVTPVRLGWRTKSKELVAAWSIGLTKSGRQIRFTTRVLLGDDDARSAVPQWQWKASEHG